MRRRLGVGGLWGKTAPGTENSEYKGTKTEQAWCVPGIETKISVTRLQWTRAEMGSTEAREWQTLLFCRKFTPAAVWKMAYGGANWEARTPVRGSLGRPRTRHLASGCSGGDSQEWSEAGSSLYSGAWHYMRIRGADPPQTLLKIHI